MTIDSVTSLHLMYNSAAYSVPGRGLLPAVAPAIQDIPRSDGATATRPARQRATSSRAVHLRQPALPRRPAAWPQPAPTTQLQGTCSVITPPPIGERSIVMSVSVCLCVCLPVRDHIFGTTPPIFNKFMCMLSPLWLGSPLSA